MGSRNLGSFPIAPNLRKFFRLESSRSSLPDLTQHILVKSVEALASPQGLQMFYYKSLPSYKQSLTIPVTELIHKNGSKYLVSSE